MKVEKINFIPCINQLTVINDGREITMSMNPEEREWIQKEITGLLIGFVCTKLEEFAKGELDV